MEMKNIEGYDGKYIIYDCGCVVSFKHSKTRPYRRLKEDTFNGGYKRVTLSKDNKQYRQSIHRLVAEYFIPNPEKKPYVNHKDGDKTNNHVSNLEWCTASENERHSYEVLGKIPSCAKKCIDKNGIIYDSITRAAKANGIKPGTLLATLNGAVKTNKTGCRLL